MAQHFKKAKMSFLVKNVAFIATFRKSAAAKKRWTHHKGTKRASSLTQWKKGVLINSSRYDCCDIEGNWRYGNVHITEHTEDRALLTVALCDIPLNVVSGKLCKTNYHAQWAGVEEFEFNCNCKKMIINWTLS